MGQLELEITTEKVAIEVKARANKTRMFSACFSTIYFLELISHGIWNVGKRFRLQIDRPFVSAERVLILGNGPYLSEDLKQITANNYTAIVAVNDFFQTEASKSIVPTHIFIQDNFWFDSGPMHPKTIALIESLRTIEKPLSLVIPARRNSSELASIASSLRSVSLVRISAKSISPGPLIATTEIPKWLTKVIVLFWSWQIVSIFPHNIVGTAVYEAIRCGAKRVDIIGHSMTMGQDLGIDLSGKLVFHSGSGSLGGSLSQWLPGKATNLEGAYQAISNKFGLFRLLSMFAHRKRCTVLNLSQGTLLDSFSTTEDK